MHLLHLLHLFRRLWLCRSIPDSVLLLAGFQLFRADRNTELSGKMNGGRICFYTNSGWCKDVTVTLQHCSSVLDTFSSTLNPSTHPMSLSREENNLDHCCTTISSSYHTIPCAALGHFVHTIVHLIPAFRQKLKLYKPIVSTSKKWTSEGIYICICGLY